MRKILLLTLFFPLISAAQIAKDYAVMVSAEVSENPPSIKIKWPAASAGSYFLYKKLKSDLNFPSTFELLPGTSTEYVDTAVVIGESYEYWVKRNMSPPSNGYINAGIKVEADLNFNEVKGRLIFLIDSAQHDTLMSEISTTINDLEGEGWTVLKRVVSQSMTVPQVKQVIKDAYNEDSENTKAIYILGHVPVPYSGNIAPDGHTNHVGAWPADAYYGDMDGNWTDIAVNNTTGSDPRTKNTPGDGKFDQSTIPSPIELQVGRVDFHDMPSFSKSETELLRAYLKKNHAYRVKEIEAEHRALIDDNFGGFSGEAFAASAWKAFTTFFPEDSIYTSVGTSIDYRTDLNARSYLWSYGCGGGSYTSASGIGNTSQIAGDSLQSVFTMLFGSYFGDWDKTDNFLKAPLAQGLTLTNVWSGRPHWYMHHMGLGDNIGHSFLKSINNSNAYSQSFKGYVHIALMGDPTLKMYVVSPPSNFQLSEVGNRVDMTWTPSTDNVLGYNIYRKDSLEGIYKKVNKSIVAGTAYTDSFFDANGTFYYAVRAVKLEDTRSGTFYNLSGGAIGEIETIYTGIESQISEGRMELMPNPSSNELNVVFRDWEKGLYNLVIQNINGQIVYSRNISVLDDKKIRISTANFSNGFYVVVLKGDKMNHSEKLIILH